jgi:hypothetical protein
MNRIAKEAGTRVMVFAALLCVFTVFYLLGCIALLRTAAMGEYIGH